ncbi:MAG TPA: Rid family hydrolase [Solirubrobacteraceae bacterium]|nr:Rid family hydrolase [Solirubrobacteraceae bacterium]
MTEIERLGGDPPSPWEEEYGFSRIVRAGQLAIFAGTAAVDGNGVVIGRTPYEQAAYIFEKLGHELTRVGARVEDVVLTRNYVTDISRADEVGRAHSEFFGAVRPVTSMVEVTALIDPRMLVEIELMAQLASAA